MNVTHVISFSAVIVVYYWSINTPMAKLSKAVTSVISATSPLDYKEFQQAYTLVRREFVARNRDKYSRECFKVGDVVKFWRASKLALAMSRWSDRANKHDPAGEVLFGVVTAAKITRSGRIMRYHIQFVEGTAWTAPSSTTRGIRQVATATEEETRVTKLLHNVRKTSSE